MNKLQFIERITQDNTWVFFLFLGSFILIVVLKTLFSRQFNDFSGLAFSKKYLSLYGNDSWLNQFSVGLILIQLISYALFIQLALSYFEFSDKFDLKFFLIILGGLSGFMTVKYLLEKALCLLFGINNFYQKFLFRQTAYRTYFGLFLLFPVFILFYGKDLTETAAFITISVFVLINIGIYLTSYYQFRKEILSKLFYFILYLCTLEIAPYYFTYYWFNR